MHPTLGILAKSQAVFCALSFSTSDGVPPSMLGYPLTETLAQTVTQVRASGQDRTQHHALREAPCGFLWERGKLTCRKSPFSGIGLAAPDCIECVTHWNKSSASKRNPCCIIHTLGPCCYSIDNGKFVECIISKKPMKEETAYIFKILSALR